MLNPMEEWQNAFGGPSPAFEDRIRQTLNHLEEGNIMKKATARTAILVFALILALTGVVYAATGGWTIGEYFNNRYDSNVNAPKDFDSGYRQEYAQELEGLTFRIRDAFVDADVFNAIVEVRRTDEKPALFRGEDCMEDDLIGFLYWDLEEDERTVRQYAEEKALPLYWVSTSFDQDQVLTGANDFWMEGDNLLAYFVSAEGVKSENGQAALTWRVYVHGQDGTLQKKEMEIMIPVEESTEWEVAVNQPVEGLPVILDRLLLRESRIGLHVDMLYHLDTDTEDKELLEAIQREDMNIWFRCIDPETGEELPGGATLGGQIDSQDDIHYIQSGDSISCEAVSDTLYLQAYDAWDKEVYGTVEVKIK